eukprot:TRINITY_DN148_c0_g1_i2.p2 TRINITY_DN148_c0_g1~~TRINITY_DN148_c0_g1_i2.p2  ORF type:complete len:213 (+),score=89.85 TRINITY_DN148_c0_g1_i2:70-708(+)
MRKLLLLLLTVYTLLPSHALYFMLNEGVERCFIEEVPPDTLVVATYSSPELPIHQSTGETIAARFTIKDRASNLILTHDADSKGKVAFTARDGGEHKICLTTNTTHWFSSPRKFRFLMRIDIGEHATDYSELAKTEHLSTIELEVRKLNDRLYAIRSEQNYERNREEDFRNTSESTNSRIMWWSIFETVVLLCSGFYQIFHLKRYFQSKKLV